MLKRLFTSKVRVKLLKLFLENPDEEFFIRELTRKLDEQINSVRRELDNLKKIGLLTSKTRNRKKYYLVNKSFIIYPELKLIIQKSTNTNHEFVDKVNKLGKIDLLILSGVFVNKESAADLLIVGEINKDDLSDLLEKTIEKPVKFSSMHKEDFLYRLKLNDQFIIDMLQSTDNIIATNKLEKYINQ
jgi:predicted transcriptional regulator